MLYFLLHQQSYTKALIGQPNGRIYSKKVALTLLLPAILEMIKFRNLFIPVIEDGVDVEMCYGWTATSTSTRPNFHRSLYCQSEKMYGNMSDVVILKIHGNSYHI